MAKSTPTPKGAVAKVEAEEVNGGGLQAVFAEMDRRDEDQIIRGITGQEIGDLLYLIPFKDNKGRGRVDYGPEYHELCSYCRNAGKDPKPHVHVTGVGIHGVNEVARLYRGIQRKITKCEKVTKDGRYYWRATAVAFDAYSCNASEATVDQPVDSQDRSSDDPRGDFARITAESKAKRNAMRDILPQFLLRGLQRMAESGQTTFTEADAKRLIDSLGESRENAIARFSLVNGLQQIGQLMAPVEVPVRSALPSGDRDNTPATPAETPPTGTSAPAPAPAQPDKRAERLAKGLCAVNPQVSDDQGCSKCWANAGPAVLSDVPTDTLPKSSEECRKANRPQAQLPKVDPTYKGQLDRAEKSTRELAASLGVEDLAAHVGRDLKQLTIEGWRDVYQGLLSRSKK